MRITAFDLAQRFVGVREIPGGEDNPHVLAMLRLDDGWPENDEAGQPQRSYRHHVANRLQKPHHQPIRQVDPTAATKDTYDVSSRRQPALG